MKAMSSEYPRYNPSQTYEWNYENPPEIINCDVAEIDGSWLFCGLPTQSPLGIPAGPLLNGKWCLYYASLGFDVLTYKTVRSTERACYPLPNLQPVKSGQLAGDEEWLSVDESMNGTWAVAFGMPSKSPSIWRDDIEQTRNLLPSDKILSVSVVGTVQEGWTIEQLAKDYAACARWACESGADCIEVNFSCPNVSTCDGQLYQNPEDARIVAEIVREAIGKVPLIIKIGQFKHSSEASKFLNAINPIANALAMTNSIATCVKDESDNYLFEGQRRGICGNAIRDASIQQTAMIHRLIKEHNYDLELVGVGGISTIADVKSYLEAGANAVQLATSAMTTPNIALEMKREWKAKFAN